MTETLEPEKKSKAELEQMVKANEGKIYQTHNAVPDTICIADRRPVKVASLQRMDKVDIIKSIWLFDCIAQDESDKPRPSILLPLEPRHMYFISQGSTEKVQTNVDEYSDSYARAVSVEELKRIVADMPSKLDHDFVLSTFKLELRDRGIDLGELPGWLFTGTTAYLDLPSLAHRNNLDGGSLTGDAEKDGLRYELAASTLRFGGGHIVEDLGDTSITHMIIGPDWSRAGAIRKAINQ